MSSYGSFKLNDGHQIPAIAFGTGSVFKWTDVTAYIEQAIELGFSHIDTAEAYDTEKCVRTAIRESGLPRDAFYVTTKFLKGDNVRASFETSLTNLGLKFVDLYLIHTPGTIPDLEAYWREYEKIREDGLAKSIGVSNFKLEDLQKLMKFAKITPVVNQIELHPYNWAENQPLLEYMNKHGILAEAYSSLTPITKKPGGPVDKPLQTIAKRIGGTPEQVIFAWLQKKGVVIVTTSSKKERLQEYLGVPTLPELTDAEVAAIEEAGAKGPPSDKSSPSQ